MNQLARGPAAGLVAVAGGIAIGERLGPSTGLGVVLASALFAVAAMRARRVGFLILALGLAGCGSMQRALHGLTDSPLRAMVTEHRHVAVRGELVDDPQIRFHSVDVMLRLKSVGETELDRRVLVTASGDVAMALGVLASGDQVMLAGTLEALDGYDVRYRWRHASARLRADTFLEFADATGIARLANQLRDATLRGLEVLPPRERGLAASFLLGDDRSVPDDTKAEFRAAGLSHLLVVSGANVAFALALVSPLLHRLRLPARLVGGGLALLVFGTMTRWEPSVSRAVAMAGLVLVGRSVGRPLDALRALLLGATVLLLVDPFLVHSLGFRLSCAASAGIAVLAGPLAARLPGPRALREAAGATLGAEIGVTPVLVPTFGSVPLIALPANLMAAPAVGAITIGGLATGVVGGIVRPLAPGLAVAVAAPVGLLVRYEAAVAHLAAGTPIALDGRSLVFLAVAGTTGVLVARARRLRRDESRAPSRHVGVGRRGRSASAGRRGDH